MTKAEAEKVPFHRFHLPLIQKFAASTASASTSLAKNVVFCFSAFWSAGQWGATASLAPPGYATDAHKVPSLSKFYANKSATIYHLQLYFEAFYNFAVFYKVENHRHTIELNRNFKFFR